jgi:hypothetical protein
MNQTLWIRALRAADARGLLVPKSSSLTPRELAAEAALRGDNRLALLVEGWYYPASYGRVHGVLTEEQAERIVSALEAETELAKAVRERETKAPAPEEPPKPRIAFCDLCGRALTA